MSGQNTIVLLLMMALFAFLFWRNLPGALLFIFPAFVRTRVAGGPERVDTEGQGVAIVQMLRDVEELGFRPLGTMIERRPLRRPQLEFVLGSTEERAYAGIRPVGNEAWLHFVTPFRGGATVITADYRWPSVDTPGYLAGGLPAATPFEVLAAHRRRVQRLLDEGHTLDPLDSLETRAATWQAYYAEGPGRRELRRRGMKEMLFTTAALASVVLLVWQRLQVR